MKTTGWLIDTDVLIDYLRGIPQAIKFLDNVITLAECYISTITVAELYGGVREGKEREILDQFIHVFQIIPIDEKIAIKGGLWRRDYSKSHNVGMADAIIAATAENMGVSLVTLNKKHYPMFKKLRVPYQKESRG